MKKLKKERRVNLMKKIKLIAFFMLLGMSMLFLLPVKVFAQFTPGGYAGDWYNYITQFNFGIADATIEHIEEWDDNKFAIIISQDPENEFDGLYLEYDVNEDLVYFEPRLQNVIEIWVYSEFSYDLAFLLEYEYEIEDFDGFIYWNFQKKYWQIDYYEFSELDYYIQRIDYLEHLVSNLTNDLTTKNIEILFLQREIQNLEGLLDTEFYRGYVAGKDEGYDLGFDDGILAGEPEAYNEGFRDGQESKLAENNEKFYNGIEKWLVPAIITVIALGGFVTIAARKRREE